MSLCWWLWLSAYRFEQVPRLKHCFLQLSANPTANDRRRSDKASEAGTPAGGGGQFAASHRPLFSYKRYADQEPLDLSLAETAAVVALVLGPEAATGLLGAEYAPLLHADSAVATAGMLPGGKGLEVRPAMYTFDCMPPLSTANNACLCRKTWWSMIRCTFLMPSEDAVAQGMQVGKMASILVKLLMDMWIAGDPHDTFALVLSMLQAALTQTDAAFRMRAFDLLYNLSLHAHMIESESPGASVARDGDSARSSAGTRVQLARVAPRQLAFSVADGGRGEVQGHLPESASVRPNLSSRLH
jgi:hypothetical protein